ncbi:MAG: hypothetical protein M3020_08995 [Myxococcota bacterium]|nr:hypothetical protein [Myxococcota bacterium]
MRFRMVGYGVVIAALGACSGKSDGDDEAGTGGVSAARGGSSSGGLPSSAGGTATGGKAQGSVSGGSDTGGAGGKASAGAPGSGGDAESGGSAAQPEGGSNGGGRPSDGGANDGGANDGGSFEAGAGESSSAGEGSGTGGGSSDRPVWCPELEACRFGADQRLAPGEACPDGRDCYEDQWCGERIQCVEYVDDGACTEEPACDAGQLTSPVCSGLGICETRSACGKSIVCETYPPSGSDCQPGLQKDRRFAAPPQKCASISISCPEGSSPFADEMCGCGCEQPEDCPDSVNCQPTSGDPRSDLCNSDECPFTQRAH